MEYIVSARKYRPMSFDTVVGQNSLVTTLKNAVKTGKLAHAYLFCGPRGVGKTTCARIFAKAINCLNPTQNGEACNECESCKSFNEQRSYNIFELDAASNNSVEHIKKLMDQTMIPPQVGKYKVFIIDEVHMLSTAAFNAFLKTLEEPPAYVIFILATTEKHKILPTIISRCQIYDFERMSVVSIINHLKNVAQKEGVNVEESALEVIAEKADGGMRDALSVFDQTASYCRGDITYAKVIENLNVLDIDNYFQITELCLKGNIPDTLNILNNILQKGFNGNHFITGFAAHIRNVMMARDSKTIQLLETSEKNKAKYKLQAEQCPIKFLYNALKILNSCDVSYKQSSNKRLLTELSLIQVAQIMQEEDTPSGGPCPNSELKPIFYKNVTSENKNVTQVTNTVASQQTATVNNNVSPTFKVEPQKPQLYKDIIQSFGNISNVEEKPIERKIEPIKVIENIPFDNDTLQLCWVDVCDEIEKNSPSVGQRLKNIKPYISKYPEICLDLGNKPLFDLVKSMKGNINNTLSNKLNNGNLMLKISLKEIQENTPVLSNEELLDSIKKENTNIALLCDELNLELV